MSMNEAAFPIVAMTDEERNRLVEEYLPLVRHVIGRLPLVLPTLMDADDLFAVGVLGLMNAAQSYSPSRGALFKTHAYLNIRGAILDELRKHDVLPRSRRDRIKLLHKTTAELEEQLGRHPTPEELAQAMGLEVSQVEDVLVNMHAAAVVSLDDDERSVEGDGVKLAECIASMSTPTPLDLAEHNEMRDRLRDAIVVLPEQERRVIVLYYAENMRLKEIGAILGVTESRVSQIHSRAILQLNRALTQTSTGSRK